MWSCNVAINVDVKAAQVASIVQQLLWCPDWAVTAVLISS
jgi:hypothetical protein